MTPRLPFGATRSTRALANINRIPRISIPRSAENEQTMQRNAAYLFGVEPVSNIVWQKELVSVRRRNLHPKEHEETTIYVCKVARKRLCIRTYEVVTHRMTSDKPSLNLEEKSAVSFKRGKHRPRKKRSI